MADYLELLEIIGKGIELHELEKKFDNKPYEFSKFIDGALKRGHVLYERTKNEKHIYKLSPEGQSYLKKEREFTKRWYKKAEWWGIIITGLIGTVGLLIAIFK